jgi:uncharacterized protein YgbK (DUF1537 family)
MLCLVIADDLTGACDAAVPFRLRGVQTRAAIGSDAEPCEVLAISTDSRDADESEIRARLEAVAARASAWSPAVVFKKIDSLLRGSPGVEIAAAVDAFACDYAVITPAFPAMGRLVIDGHLHVRGVGSWEPVHVETRLGLPAADATCDEDLDAIVAQGLASGCRILWAGSAGLSFALSRALYPGPAPSPPSPGRGSAPLLFCVGSDHAVTAAQRADLSTRRRARVVPIDRVAPSLSAGGHAILRIPRNMPPQVLHELFAKTRDLMGGLLLTGGDTASLVCRAAGFCHIELMGEIVTGLPWGRIEGGALHGLPVATKSGAFGASDALTRVADFFTI